MGTNVSCTMAIKIPEPSRSTRARGPFFVGRRLALCCPTKTKRLLLPSSRRGLESRLGSKGSRRWTGLTRESQILTLERAAHRGWQHHAPGARSRMSGAIRSVADSRLTKLCRSVSSALAFFGAFLITCLDNSCLNGYSRCDSR